jgi:tRNA threonylcarbamoyl adenosine modification protein YeaZ
LVPLIAALPQRGRAERICVSLGPGSFTGVRIGLAAARALGLAWGAPVLGFPTLALVAAMAQAQAGGPVSVAMLGGHGEWFVQDFNEDGAPDGALASHAPAQATQFARHPRVAGSAAEPLVALRGYGTAQPLLPDARLLHLLPDALLTPSLAPLYGRAPDARVQPPRAGTSAATIPGPLS